MFSTSKANKDKQTVSARIRQGVPTDAKIASAIIPNSTIVLDVSTTSQSMTAGDDSSLRLSTTAKTPDDYSSIQGSSVKPSNNLYELLEGNLKTLYTARDRNATMEERWRFRGSYLLLNIATQACPSNPVYDLFSQQKPDESALVLSILQQHADAMKSTNTPLRPLSRLPAAPYSKPNNEHTRYDSAFSTVSHNTSTSVPPTISELWYTIFRGSIDPSKTVAAATAIIEAACSDMNAMDVIETLGDPRLQFTHEDEFRVQLRERLFPGYNDHVQASTSTQLRA